MPHPLLCVGKQQAVSAEITLMDCAHCVGGGGERNLHWIQSISARNAFFCSEISCMCTILRHWKCKMRLSRRKASGEICECLWWWRLREPSLRGKKKKNWDCRSRWEKKKKRSSNIVCTPVLTLRIVKVRAEGLDQECEGHAELALPKPRQKKTSRIFHPLIKLYNGHGEINLHRERSYTAYLYSCLPLGEDSVLRK